MTAPCAGAFPTSLALPPERRGIVWFSTGAETVKDGTSAVAPLWAALIAMANAQRDTPLGLVNSALYANPSLFRPITQGNNRADGKGYDAGPGWNACTGLGVPKGADIIAALAAIPIA
jgi:kumamolisin